VYNYSPKKQTPFSRGAKRGGDYDFRDKYINFTQGQTDRNVATDRPNVSKQGINVSLNI